MTTELRRLPGPRVCLVPLFISFAFAVGYLMGNRSSPVNVNSDMVVQDVPMDRRLLGSAAPQPDPKPQDAKISVAQPSTQPQSNFSQNSVNAPALNVNVSQGVTKATKRPPLEYEIVVSHYNEPLDWLKQYAQAGHVYHKGNNKGPPFEMYKWEKIPNVGREAHTYLYHIIDNYDNLADLTIFMQGSGTGDHREWCYTPAEFVTNAKSKNFCKKHGTFSGWGRINHFGKWLAELNSGKMRRAKTTVGQFYTALFGTPPPARTPRCLAGCFAASRDNLRLHPLSFYQKAITFVNDHSNPEEAHYFERLWGAIINA